MEATEIVLAAVGEPESLQVRTRRLPALRAGQALVRVEASGVSFAEQQMRRGKYYDQPPFPFVPGYDLVGTVEALGGDTDGDTDGAIAVGRRVAALTKIGGWADRVILDVADLVPVPDGVDAAAAETVVVNGVTAWRMLHGAARVRAGETIVVHGASGGVGSTLVQLARHAGIRVIGTASPAGHDRLRELGAIPVDYKDDVPAHVRRLAPDGVAAVFDHVGGPGIADSWRMLARGGTLVAYGSASTRDKPGSGMLTVFKLVARLAMWNALPNGRHATFFNLWAGKARHLGRFRAALRDDLSQVFALLAGGHITAQVARTFPLTDAAAALRFAEAGGFTGKVVILPGPRA
ncbi:zinc-binding dehydrogenase [Streptosporangiaceae bacterium NEAU-GS5]|nr:zinc-binding dehydrogenase [Streptosporangiaceae bacterium NEAU-GS5]